MASSCYTRLPQDSVRLLRLLPPNPNPDNHSRIECCLFTCALLNSGVSHPYEALSYVWGCEGAVGGKKPCVVVNGHELTVTPNLYTALLHLRDPFMERTLWIDALCINQQDDVEKGHQVQSMAKIYAKASRVVVWLGESTTGSDEALRNVLMAAETWQQPERSIDVYGKQERAVVANLLERPWFQRIWVWHASWSKSSA